MSMGVFVGNAEISDTANLLIFEACLAGFDVYIDRNLNPKKIKKKRIPEPVHRFV